MQPETTPLKKSDRLERKKPDQERDYDLTTQRKDRRNTLAANKIIDLVRRRFYESKEKFRLRKELRAERNRLRKIQRAEKRRRRVGRKILENTTKVEK